MSTSMPPGILSRPTFSPLHHRRRPAAWLAIALEWDRRHRERVHLARLDPGHLLDMGLTPEFVAAECAKPFWRA